MQTVSPLFVFEGFFTRREGALFVSEEEGGEAASLENLLSPYVGTRVEFQFHFWPPSPLVLTTPGLGCCLSPTSCPLHRGDPGHMISYRGEGVLGAGASAVGDEPLPWDVWAGHRARVVIFAELSEEVDALDKLVIESKAMEDLLRNLEEQATKLARRQEWT